MPLLWNSEMIQTETKSNFRLSTSDFRLPVMEHFYTIQGEGFHQGKAAYFIRLGGCDVGCVWCDVKESWDASKHPMKSVEEISEAAKNFHSTICVFTSGEQMMS